MDQHTMRNVQEAMQKEANIFQSFQEPLQKLAVSKGQYEAQINENEAVLKVNANLCQTSLLLPQDGCFV